MSFEDWKSGPRGAEGARFLAIQVDELYKLSLRVPPAGKTPREAVTEMRDFWLSALSPNALAELDKCTDPYERKQRLKMISSWKEAISRLSHEAGTDQETVRTWMHEECLRVFNERIEALPV